MEGVLCSHAELVRGVRQAAAAAAAAAVAVLGTLQDACVYM
jgi:hypothetical protein